MPAKRTNMEVAGTVEVKGNKRAIVKAGAMPGKRPTKVPARHQANP